MSLYIERVGALGLFLKLFQEVLVFWTPVRGPWWVPRCGVSHLGIKVWREVSQLHASSFIIWNGCQMQWSLRWACFCPIFEMGKRHLVCVVVWAREEVFAEEGVDKMVWGEESHSPKSESRALFGAGLGHCFCFLPARVRRLVTQKSCNGCSPFVELYFMLVQRLAESTLHFYILIFFLFFCSRDQHRYLMEPMLFSLGGW